ncbi:hypothetical protein AB0383_19535 [Amycolatopsis sp. NPDC051373]|uniref:hypothetical protein n=1 Tax=Amycolatopsis sp. NPDC051373 TaxID=3155801 RepID=UPI00344D0844
MSAPTMSVSADPLVREIEALAYAGEWAAAAELADQSYRVTLQAEAERAGRTPEDLHREACEQLRAFLNEQHAAEAALAVSHD